jgi:hypothetical protein
MKALKLIVFGIVLCFAGTTQAQLSVRLNFGSPPLWGPVGYTDVHYYYLPDVQAYYDIDASMFIYSSGGRWVHRSSLPYRYRNYDLYGGYKVAMNGYRGSTPYSNYNNYRTQYPKGYRGEEQRTIGQRMGKSNNYNNKYYRSHSDQKGNKGIGRGNDKGNKRNNEHGNGGR